MRPILTRPFLLEFEPKQFWTFLSNSIKARKTYGQSCHGGKRAHRRSDLETVKFFYNDIHFNQLCKDDGSRVKVDPANEQIFIDDAVK